MLLYGEFYKFNCSGISHVSINNISNIICGDIIFRYSSNFMGVDSLTGVILNPKIVEIFIVISPNTLKKIKIHELIGARANAIIHNLPLGIKILNELLFKIKQIEYFLC